MCTIVYRSRQCIAYMYMYTYMDLKVCLIVTSTSISYGVCTYLQERAEALLLVVGIGDRRTLECMLSIGVDVNYQDRVTYLYTHVHVATRTCLCCVCTYMYIHAEGKILEYIESCLKCQIWIGVFFFKLHVAWCAVTGCVRIWRCVHVCPNCQIG